MNVCCCEGHSGVCKTSNTVFFISVSLCRLMNECTFLCRHYEGDQRIISLKSAALGVEHFQTNLNAFFL